jgi:hypothetical protein
MFSEENKSLATGNFLFAQGNNRLAASAPSSTPRPDSARFYNAWGIASVQPPRRAPRPGVAVPMQANQETCVPFFGEGRKIGPKKCRITKGGFHLRAADAALGSARRHGDAQHRSLRC